MLHMRHATFSWHQQEQQQHKLKQTATGQTREVLAFYRCYRKGKFQRCHQCDSSKWNLLQFLVLIRYTNFKQLTTGGVAVGLVEIKNQLESFWKWIHFIVYSVFVFFSGTDRFQCLRSHCPFQLCCQFHLERSHIGGRNKFTAQFGIQKWEMLRLTEQLSRKTPGISKTNPS